MKMAVCRLCGHNADLGVLSHVGCFGCGAPPWQALSGATTSREFDALCAKDQAARGIAPIGVEGRPE